MVRPRTLTMLALTLLAALLPAAASANTCDCYEGNQQFVQPSKYLDVGPGVVVEVSGTSAPYLLSAYRAIDHVGIHNVVVPSSNFTVRSDYNGYLYAVIYDNGGVTTLMFYSGGTLVYQVSGSVSLLAIGPNPLPMSGISSYFVYSQSFGDDNFLHFIDGSGTEVYGESGYRLGFDGFGPNGRLALLTEPVSTETQIQLINFETGSAELTQTLAVGADFSFSICSDEFGWVMPDAGAHLFDVEMHGTRNAGVSGSTSVSMDDVTGLTLAADTASFIAHGFDTNLIAHSYVLATNAPAPPCPPAPTPIAVSTPSTEVPGGVTVQGTVTISGPAPFGGMSVGMMSDNNSVASADNASIAAGQTQGSFTITTHTVQYPQTAVIHPSTSLTPSITLTVDSAPPQLQGIYVFPAVVPSGTQAEIDFVLSSPALGAGAVIALSSSDTTVLKLPPTVTVPFSIPSTYVFVTPPYSGTDHTVVVTASYLGVTLHKTILVQGPRPSSLLSMDPCIVSGQPIHARVELTIPAPPGGIDIAVVSSDTTQPKMPFIHIRHDQTVKEFDVPTTAVGGTEGLTLTAVGNGIGTALNVNLVPPQPFWLNAVEPYNVHEYYPTNDAYGMNNYGEVAGDVDSGSGYPSLAYSWFPGNLRILPDLAGMSPPSVALAINDLRQVTGTEGGHAFRYDGTQMLDLTPNGGTGRAISSHGEVAGGMTVSGFPHAFYYDGTLHDLGTLGGTSSQANGINEADVVVGWAFVASGQAHPFLWTAGGGMQDLGVPPGMTQAYALAINRGGVVAGYAVDGSSLSHPYKWVSGVPQQLDAFLGGAVAINDAGQIVGTSNNHPVLWDGATRTQLDQLGGNCGGWDSTVEPSAVNNRGQIAGTGQTESGPVATVLSFAQGPTTAVPHAVVVPANFDLAVLGANPVHGVLQMVCSFAHPGPATLDLVDIAGRRVATRQLNGAASEEQIAIPEAGALSPGVYFARLRQGTGARVARVVLVR